MVTYLYEFFFRKAREVDPVTKKYVNPEMAKAAEEIGTRKTHGIGSKLGGYICICDYCGRAFPTYDNLRRFCDTDCRIAYGKTRYRPMSFRQNKVPCGAVTRNCECCGSKFKVLHSIVDDGRGLFCNLKCFHKFRLVKPIWFVCNHCKTKFKAITSKNALFCCDECRDAAPDYTNDRIYIEYSPIFYQGDIEAVDEVLEMNDHIIHAYLSHVKDKFGSGLSKMEYPRLTRDIVDPIKKKYTSDE